MFWYSKIFERLTSQKSSEVNTPIHLAAAPPPSPPLCFAAVVVVVFLFVLADAPSIGGRPADAGESYLLQQAFTPMQHARVEMQRDYQS